MSTTLAEFIDKILEETSNPVDGSGYLTRANVKNAASMVQREISRLTENIYSTTATVTPSAAATTMTIDANGNMLRGATAYLTYDSITKEIYFYTEQQIAAFDLQWKTRTGDQVRGLITGISGAGIARLYPIPDAADNDIVVNYIKLATNITLEHVEAGDAANQLSSWLFYGVSGDNTNAGVLYWSVTNATTTRTVSVYKSATKTAGNLVAQGSRTGDGSITLSAQNSSGLTGSVTVAYTIDDSDAANLITFTNLEISDADIPCLEFGTKAYLYNLEKDGKNTEKGNFWKQLYGMRDPASGMLTGELSAVKSRAMKERGSTYSVMQERVDPDVLRTRPLYSWEI